MQVRQSRPPLAGQMMLQDSHVKKGSFQTPARGAGGSKTGRVPAPEEKNWMRERPKLSPSHPTPYICRFLRFPPPVALILLLRLALGI